jgi:hypothetical protein
MLLSKEDSGAQAAGRSLTMESRTARVAELQRRSADRFSLSLLESTQKLIAVITGCAARVSEITVEYFRHD